MKQLQERYPVRLIYRVLGGARSTYYRDAAAPDAAGLRDALTRLAGRWPTYGYRRLTQLLRRAGLVVNTKRVRRLMHELGLKPKIRRKTRSTTNSRHAFPRYPNRVADLVIERPDQVWVADITYIRLRREVVYLAVLMDVFTRQLRGWHLSCAFR